MEVEEMKPEVSSRLKISDGVASLGGEIGKMSKLRRNGPIRISMMGDVAAIDMKIVIKSGEKAVNVAQEVQTVVKENVQNMTGVPVARVNVIVSGVVFE